MHERRSPTLRRRRLATELKKLREAAGMTGAAVEKHFGWSPSKISRMEKNDWTLPNLRDVRDLLDLYGVADEARREELLGWARDGRQKGWWDAYKDLGLSLAYSNYVSLEAEARGIASFQTGIMPGLVQIPSYARALMTDPVQAMSAEEVEKRVEIRINRQQLLYGEDALHLTMVLDEAVLRRVIGSDRIMREQIQHLAKVAELPNVTVYIVPFESATNLSTHNPFTIMEFPHAGDQNAAFIETLAGDLFIEEPKEVRRYEVAFRHHTGAALNPPKSLDMLTKLI